MKEITRNKKAFFDYEILETQQAGIELRGHEVNQYALGKYISKEHIFRV